MSLLARPDQRLYGIYLGVTGKLGARAPDASLKNLCWQGSCSLNEGIFVSSRSKVIILKLTEEIPPRLFYANHFQALQYDLLPSAA